MENHDLEYFKFIRQEILDRIGIHYKTLVIKFITVGATFSFLAVKGKDLDLSPFLPASILSCLFDILLLENLGWIRSAGTYIKNEVEDGSFHIKWEREFAQYNDEWQCFAFWPYVLGVWFIGLILLLGFLVPALFERRIPASIIINCYLCLVAVFFCSYSFWVAWRKLK
ncbi:MAG: hypothetical protein ACYSX1_06035 [Planctomycetota bacterium]|jgi:hypothetical protein